MATLDALNLPRELAHWSFAQSTIRMPITPPGTDAVGHRPLQQFTTTSYVSHSQHNVHGQLLTPPDDDERDVPSYTPHTNTTIYRPPPPEEPADKDGEESGEGAAWAHDWLHVSRARPESAALVAEKTCEMICYLWFAPSSSAASTAMPSLNGKTAEGVAGREGRRDGRTTPSQLQLTASKTFVAFTQKLLETTQSLTPPQVSQSVIVLALHYIHRLRARNAATPAQPGSEFRVAVAGLMMANKFLDDNTYTNATWAAVSLIPLPQINTMEREFLAGVGYTLFVSQKVYEDWGRLLRGLVGAMRARRERGAARHRGGRLQHPHPHPHHDAALRARRGTAPAQRVVRRRSVSPTPVRGRTVYSSSSSSASTYPCAAYPVNAEGDVEMRDEWEERPRGPRDDRDDREEREGEGEGGGAGSKRRAAAAFSPGSYHPPPLAHHGHHFAPMQPVPVPAYAAPSSGGMYGAQQQGHQRPTLVIPQFAASNAHASSSHSGNTSTSTSNSGSGSGSGSYSTTSSTSAYDRLLPPAHSHAQQGAGSSALSTPLERFGALSLASAAAGSPRGYPHAQARGESATRPGTGTGTGERERRRERPVSYAGAGSLCAWAERASSSSSSSSASSANSTAAGAGAYLSAPTGASYAAGFGGNTTTQAQTQAQSGGGGTATYAAGAAFGVYGNGNGNGANGTHTTTTTPYKTEPSRAEATLAGYKQSPFLARPAAPAPGEYEYEYVPPAPSTVVQYAPGAYAAQGPAPHVPASQLASSQAPTPGRYALPETLTARWEYPRGGGAAQDLYFYALAASPVSTSSDASSPAEEEGCACGECRARYVDEGGDGAGDGEESDEDEDEDEDEGEEDEDEDEDDASSIYSDDGRGEEEGDVRMGYAPPPVPSTSTANGYAHTGNGHVAAHPHPTHSTTAPTAPRTRPRRPSNAEDARRARLRVVPLPPPPPPPHPSLAQPHAPFDFAPANAALGGLAGGRWGVQSARTSPVRAPPEGGWTPPPAPRTFACAPHPHSQERERERQREEWTPPRAAYAQGGGAEWTPPRASQEWTPPRASRVALPRFADLERWSGGVDAAAPPTQTQPQHHVVQPQQRATHPHQPRRAVFANAGPPGVSGYAYAY
ncbi:hypothetical protein DFH07DRAFT_954760 [Mycena maculata]|uniref:Cyclin N-terminal domain-containing protein n=1 Tax=Mycena maculata TaxID=230809 RepID=A0AAD7JMQ6_9AGAR|nr:hypothetical protein DFH07DRAFT_954760 [Mycena maculata]